MSDSDRRELHQVAILIGDNESDAVEQLARSPIGDDCQSCPVCRAAREYVDRRLAELTGRVFPPDQSGEAAWRKLQAAVKKTKSAVRGTA